MGNIYSEQLLQLIFEEIRTFRNSLRTNEPNIQSKFELLLASLPEKIRHKVAERMIFPLIKLKRMKDAYDKQIEYKSGFTNSDRRGDFHIYDMNTYTPLLSYIIDELNAEFAHQENDKNVNGLDMS